MSYRIFLYFTMFMAGVFAAFLIELFNPERFEDAVPVRTYTMGVAEGIDYGVVTAVEHMYSNFPWMVDDVLFDVRCNIKKKEADDGGAEK